MDQLKLAVKNLFEYGADLGILLIKAVIILVVGRLIIKFINKFIKRLMTRERIDASVQTFVASLINILLNTLLFISIIGVFGIQTTSFAALLASCGVAIGVALSGNLSNFAGGIIILTFKPFRVGDYIVCANGSGTVLEIQIFHTILRTSEGLTTYIPNGSLSSGYVNNYNVQKRRIEWIIGVDYDSDFQFVKQTISEILAEDKRILGDSTPLIELAELAESSVNIIVRVWVLKKDYDDVRFAFNRNVYERFNKLGISFPFPQITVHQAIDSEK